MATFKKKPTEITAIIISAEMTVKTLEGTMTGMPGDFLITGIRGEHYFCKPDIFKDLHDPVDDEGKELLRLSAEYQSYLKDRIAPKVVLDGRPMPLSGDIVDHTEDLLPVWNRVVIRNRHTRKETE